MLQQPRLFLGIGVVFCLGGVFGTSPARAESEVIHRSFSVEDVRFVSTPQGLEIRLASMKNLERAGLPGLPFENILIAAPRGKRVHRVKVSSSGWARVSLPGALRRAPQEDVPGVLPREVASHDGGGWARGKRLESFSFYPVRWQEETPYVEFPREIEIRVDWETDLREHRVVAPRQTPWESRSRFQKLGRRREQEKLPNQAESPASGSQPFNPRFNPSLDGSPVRYLIVTSEAMLDPFLRLAARKTALGMPAQVRTTSWIQATYPAGVDEAETIRNFLIEAVQKWGVEYVLLGGDVEDIPIRTSRNEYFGGDNIPTDMYYACLDGNWNENGNSVFAETGYTGGDAVDLYPDVWVGRAAVRDSSEADVFVSKLKTYETERALAGGFTEDFLVLAEVLEPQNWHDGDPVYFDGSLLSEEAVARVSPNIVPNRYYENFTAYPGSAQLTKPVGLQEIDYGYNLVLHVGHGYRNTMVLGLNGEAMTNSDADLRRNGKRQGLLYAINCTSSALDFDCIAEHLMRNSLGGFCGGIGSTRLDFPSTGRNYQNEFFDLIYQEGVTKIGEAAALQKVPFISQAIYDGPQRWTQASLIYLGDPDFDFYTGPLDSFFVSVGTPLTLDAGSISVTVTDNSGAVDSAVVCLQRAGEAYFVGFTNASGMITLPFTPDTEGGMTLGVRKHDHWIRIDSLTVGPASSEHLYVSSLLIDDSALGDGDGNLEAGETALVYPTITNSGISPAADVSLTVVGLPSGVTAPDNTAAFGSVGAGASVLALDPLQFVIAGTVPDLTAASVSVDLSATAYNRQENVVLYLGSPRVGILSSALSDTVGNGNGNGTIEPGEDFILRTTLINRGVGISRGLAGTLVSADPMVTIVDGTSAYGELDGGSESAGDGFQLSISDGDLSRPITLTITDQSGVVRQRTLELSSPAAPTSLFASGKTNSILLTWDVAPEPDAKGYVLYRSLQSGGPYTRLNHDPRDLMALYDDDALTPLTRYYYRVAALDSSGIEGPQSGESEATTSLPSHTGYPMLLGTSAASSPCLGYYNGDPIPEIVTGGDQMYVFTSTGSELIDGDSNVQTTGVFSNTGFGPFWGPPSTADLDGDGIPEIVGGTWGSGYLFVWDSRGVVKPGFPKDLNPGSSDMNIWSAPALADIDNDGDLEIFINAHTVTYAFHHDGTEVADGDNNPLTDGIFLVMGAGFNYSTPALADVDNDGVREVIVGSRDGNLYVMEADSTPLPNFPLFIGGEITNSPAVADLDKDGFREIIFASSLFQGYAYNINLEQPPGWPVGVNMNKDLDASPAIADMNSDGFLDVVFIGGNGTPFIYQGQNGAALPGWGGGFVLYNTDGSKVPLTSSPAVGNLDLDPDLEICFGGGDGNIYAFNTDRTPVEGFPIATGNSIDRGAVLWDVDGDGLTEVIAQSFDEQLYVWDSPGVFDSGNQPWPLFHGNSRRTGVYGDELWTYIGTDPIEPLQLVLTPNRPNPFRSHTDFRVLIPGALGRTQATLSIYDIQGRLVRSLYSGPLGPGNVSFSWNGLTSAGDRLGAGVYFYRLATAGKTTTRKMVLLP